MVKRSVVAAVVSAVSFFTIAAPLARATSVAPPANLGQLARLSRAVVFAQAVDSWVEKRADESLPYTITRFHQLAQVTGEPTGFVFEVREPGGVSGGKGAAVPGAPRYATDRNYLLFLDRAPDGRWRSKMLAYGLLVEEEESGLLHPLPEADRVHPMARKSFEPVGIYRQRALLDHLREVARGAPWDSRKAESLAFQGAALQTAGAPLQNLPQYCEFITDGGDGLPLRWFGYEDGSQTAIVIPTTPGQTGISDGGVSAIQQGAAAWTDHPDSAIRLLSGSPRPRSLSCSDSFDFDQNAAVFNDPCNDLADLSMDCVGTLAFGGAIYDNHTSRTYDGDLWHPIFNLFVVVNNGAQCVGEVDFKEVLTHELGHTQGFGHHNPPNPADATMSAFLKGDGRGASIASVDKICASYAYHTFLDVPYAHMFWRHIEAIENARITRGCGVAVYCPENSVSRAEMAVFLERGLHGSDFVPPAASGTLFDDVPKSFWAADFIEQLAMDGISRGCGANVFCPNATVTRAQMAIFLVRVKHGTGFAPPPATGMVFADVPADYWAAAYIEQLFADGITGGCATDPRRYCPDANVTRGEMAVFLARVLNLPLP